MSSIQLEEFRISNWRLISASDVSMWVWFVQRIRFESTERNVHRRAKRERLTLIAEKTDRLLVQNGMMNRSFHHNRRQIVEESEQSSSMGSSSTRLVGRPVFEDWPNDNHQETSWSCWTNSIRERRFSPISIGTDGADRVIPLIDAERGASDNLLETLDRRPENDEEMKRSSLVDFSGTDSSSWLENQFESAENFSIIGHALTESPIIVTLQTSIQKDFHHT